MWDGLCTGWSRLEGVVAEDGVGSGSGWCVFFLGLFLLWLVLDVAQVDDFSFSEEDLCE